MAHLLSIGRALAACLALVATVSGCSKSEPIIVERDNSRIHCLLPDDLYVEAGGEAAVDLSVYQLGTIIKGNASLERKVQQIREEFPGTYTYESMEARACLAYADGRITADGYRDFVNNILALLFPQPKAAGTPSAMSDIKSEVAIHRVADFRQSGCDKAGKAIDATTFDDTVTFLTRVPAAYPAVAIEEGDGRVEVFDLNVSDEVPLKPTVSEVSGRRHKSFLVSTNDGTARVRYVWTNAHKIEKELGIGITSDLFLRRVSGQILIPDGVDLEPIGVEPEGQCVVNSDKSFNCPTVNDPYAVQYFFETSLWASCRSS